MQKSMGLPTAAALLAGLLVSVSATPLHAQTAAAPRTCTVDHSQSTEGEIALAKEDYDAALTFYRNANAKTPDSPEIKLGLIRALIGKDQTAEATKQAAEVVAKFPQSALAKVAAGEAAFRDADFDAANQDAIAAYKLDSCEARALDLLAEMYDVSARYATGARVLAVAHQIRPNDELILRDWIESLPRSKRAEELNKYLAGPASLSTSAHEGYVNQQDYLKAHHTGECHIISKSEQTKIPFTPIYGNSHFIEAYGLDVSFNRNKRRLQIDTGASGIVLTPAAARRLGLTREYKLHTGGVGDEGEVESYLTHVENIQIGDVELSDCMVEVLAKYKVGDTIDGLIGLDVFYRWLATLDYPNRQLLLSPLPPQPGGTSRAAQNPVGAAGQAQDDDDDIPKDAIEPSTMQDWLHIIRIGHDIFLPAKINSSPLRYIIMDTGSHDSSFSIVFAKEAGKMHRDTDVEVTGLSGKVKEVYRVDNTTLRFGSIQLPPGSFYAFDLTKLSHDTGAEVSGFAGFSTLSRLTITVDYRDNLMQMKYDPNHDPAKYLLAPSPDVR